MDSFVLIFWSMTKVSMYYGFTFIYLSLFKKDKIDVYLRIFMVFIFIATLSYVTVYFIDDLMSSSLKEISVTKKRSIYIASLINAGTSLSVAIVGAIAILSDLIYVGVLIYSYIKQVKQTNKNHSDAIKAVILLSISTTVFVFLSVCISTNSDIKWLVFNPQLTIDTICLFLMFKSNQLIYDNLCGCLCRTCCISLCFGSQYTRIPRNDHDDDSGNVLI
eukprot:221930_1